MEDQGRLLTKARQGDAGAFEALCAPYAGMVYRHCLQMLGRPADAEDAAQETLLRAYRAIPRFVGNHGVASWLFRIAHNACLDVLKRPMRKAESASMEQLLGEGFEPAAKEAGPEEEYLRKTDARHLWAAVKQLPQDQQMLLTLRYGSEMSYEDLARATGLKEGTVKSKLNRAKERLRGLLTP